MPPEHEKTVTRIGVDFDNTIVCYDSLFYRVALERELIAPDVPPLKTRVRDALRQRGQDHVWTKLQGVVYGERLGEAKPFPGVLTFFHTCRRVGIPTCIISHKTPHPVIGPPTDLHAAARGWLNDNGFFETGETGLDCDRAFFEPTKQAKFDRIHASACSHFIDDLPEFLRDPDFPDGVCRILFDPRQIHPECDDYVRAAAWDEISEFIEVSPYRV